MPQDPKPQSTRHPLRQLRGLLSEDGEESPITQQTLSRITDVPFNSVKSVESGRRSLTCEIGFKILRTTGAVWNDEKKIWMFAFAWGKDISFNYLLYREYRRLTTEPPPDQEFDVELLQWKLGQLFQNVPKRFWYGLLFRMNHFLERCREDFGLKQLKEPFKATTIHFMVDLNSQTQTLSFQRWYPEIIRSHWPKLTPPSGPSTSDQADLFKRWYAATGDMTIEQLQRQAFPDWKSRQAGTTKQPKSEPAKKAKR
jgi:hypothetical protein